MFFKSIALGRHAAWRRTVVDQVHAPAYTEMVHRSHGPWHAVIALILEWVLIECESMGPRVIPLAHFPRRYSSFMYGQAKGRSEYVSPKEYSSGSYELGIHFATGPAWLGSH